MERTILSLINQEYRNKEIIIVDGGSTDSSIDIINKYINLINIFISERDSGIYDAMNKGINHASGNYLYFIGSDDVLLNDQILYNVSINLAKLGFSPMIYFGSVLTGNNIIFRSNFSLLTNIHNTVHHQSAFYNIELFNEFRYNTTLKIMSDYELNLIVFLNKLAFHKSAEVVAICAEGGISTKKSSFFTAINETNLIKKNHLPGLIYFICKYIYLMKVFIGNYVRYK